MARIEGRKADHINITLNEDVTPGYRYWDDIRFITRLCLRSIMMISIQAIWYWARDWSSHSSSMP